VAAAGEIVMSVAATTQGQVALGLYGSGLWLTDNGNGPVEAIVWQQPEVALHAPPVVMPVGDDYFAQLLFAHDADGQVARSADGGAQWTDVADKIPAVTYALSGTRHTAADGAPLTTLFAATDRGLARWDEASGNWQLDLTPSLSEGGALGVDLSPTFVDDQTVLVVGHANDLYIATDGGVTLQAVSGPWAGHSLLSARFAPMSAAEVVAVTAQPTGSGHFALAVWESHDQGQTWATLAGLTSGVPAVVMAWPHDPSERAIFLATQHRVIKLYMEGEPSTLQLHQHFFDENVRVTALAVAPDYSHKQIIWAATSEGLYRSVDRGMSWALMLDLPQGLPVVSLAVSTTHVNAITLGGRVWRAAL
jgi:hypothetical protein